jgi:hypothetical protein
MSKRIELPDGSIGEFPDAMDDAAIEGVLRKQFAPDQSAAETQRLAGHPPPPTNPVTDALLGVGDLLRGASNARNRLVRGVRFGAAGAPEQTVPEGKQAGDYVGEISADIGMAAAPVAGAARGLTALSRALRAGRYAPLAGDVAANAGYSALTAPEDRGEAAALGGAGALGGRALFRGLGGVVRPTAQAQELLDQGVRMTPGQAGGGAMGSLAKMYEGAIGEFPLIGSAVRGAQKQGLDDWNRAMLQRAEGGASVVPDRISHTAPIGQPGLSNVKGAYDKAYGEFFPQNTVLRFTDEGAKAFDADLATLRSRLPDHLRGRFDEFATDIADRIKAGVPAPLWKETITGDIQAIADSAYRNGDNSLVRAFAGMRGKILDRMNAAHIKDAPNPHELVGTDAGYRDYKVLQAAGRKGAAVRRGGTLYPSDVVVEAAKKGATGLEKDALAAQEMFGNAPTTFGRIPNMLKAGAIGAAGVLGPAAASIPIGLATVLGSTPAGRQFLLGQTKFLNIQQFLQAHPEIASQVGRTLSTQQSE